MPVLPRTPARTRNDSGTPRSNLGPSPRVGCRRRDQPTRAAVSSPWPGVLHLIASWGWGRTPRPWSPRMDLATRRRPSRVNRGRRARRLPCRRAGLRRKPRCDARRGQPLRQPVPTLCAHCLAHSVIRASACSRTGVGSRRHRRVADAAPVPDAPRRPPATDHAANAVALWCVTLRASNPRGARGATVRSPNARRHGISPPARPCPAAVILRRIPSNTLSCPRNRRGPLYTGDYTRE
jgi:hypothetical protein